MYVRYLSFITSLISSCLSRFTFDLLLLQSLSQPRVPLDLCFHLPCLWRWRRNWVKEAFQYTLLTKFVLEKSWRRRCEATNVLLSSRRDSNTRVCYSRERERERKKETSHAVCSLRLKVILEDPWRILKDLEVTTGDSYFFDSSTPEMQGYLWWISWNKDTRIFRRTWQACHDSWHIPVTFGLMSRPLILLLFT